jgi:hypothetical protein
MIEIKPEYAAAMHGGTRVLMYASKIHSSTRDEEII